MTRRGQPPLSIGVDLDNTLIDYDSVFRELAVGSLLVPESFAGDKRQLRDLVRQSGGGEEAWQRLQAQAYGPAILRARPAPGALEFLREARRRDAELAIVSHKTRYAAVAPDGPNLHDAARQWLIRHGICGSDCIPTERLFFEETRSAKIARIAHLGCTHFIDDLEEVLEDPAFPADVRRLLLSSTITTRPTTYRSYASFHEIGSELFGG